MELIDAVNGSKEGITSYKITVKCERKIRQKSSAVRGKLCTNLVVFKAKMATTLVIVTKSSRAVT